LTQITIDEHCGRRKLAEFAAKENLGDVGHGEEEKKPDVLHSRRSNSLFDCAVRGLCGRCEIMKEKMAFAETGH